jgi:hypothetical protein
MQEFPTIFKFYITFIVDQRNSNISIKGTRMYPSHLQGSKDMMQKLQIGISIYHEMEHSKDSMHNAFCSSFFESSSKYK